jgi:hypothetical protein
VLTILGFSMVICFMYLIMTKRLSALIALILIPILFALIGGHYAGLGAMMLDGVKTLAPTGVMLTFSILYFGIMIDAGLFDGLVRFILKLVKGDPLKVLVGTAVLTMLVSLDGDSSTTYMIACAAFLPLYQRLGMSVLGMTCLVNIASGIMNISPWGGPTARAAAALHVDAMDIFVPMIPGMLIGAACLVFTAVILGRKERARLGIIHLDDFHNGSMALGNGSAEECDGNRRPKMFWPNLILTLTHDHMPSTGHYADPDTVHGRLCHCDHVQLSEDRGSKSPHCSSRSQRTGGNGSHLRCRYLHWNPGWHRHGGFNGQEPAVCDSAELRAIPCSIHCCSEPAVHLFHVQRRVLLRDPASHCSDRCPVRHYTAGNCPRVRCWPAGSPIESSRALALLAGCVS